MERPLEMMESVAETETTTHVPETSTVSGSNVNNTSEDSKILADLDEKYSKCGDVDIREITIERVQNLFEDGLLNSTQLTKCYLERIEKFNPYLKAIIELNPDALEIASELDEERKNGSKRGSLHGIPILLKDNYATKDKMETAAGSLALVGVKPKRDAEVVRRLRESGVVILGKTNLGEMSYFRGTNIPNGWSGRGGQTKNAYNILANPQGSSSGSAVATSVNLAVATLGTETDGSLISPSSVAACVSMKSTHGLVPIQGIIPISANQDTVGPITRTVMDTAILLDGMVGESNSNKSESLQNCGGSYESCLGEEYAPEEPFRIGIPRKPFWTPELANSTLLECELPYLNQLLEKINTSPADMVELKDPLKEEWEYLKNISDVEITVVTHDFKHDLNAYLEQETVSMKAGENETQIRTLKDIIEYNKLHPSPEGYNQTLLELAEATDGVKNETYLKLLRENKENAVKYLDLLLDGNHLDAVATPSEPRFNVSVDPTLGQSPFVGTTLAAVAGYPSITVPAGYDKYGIPFGICFIGRRNSEVTLLRIAQLVERLWPVRKPPKFLSVPLSG